MIDLIDTIQLSCDGDGCNKQSPFIYIKKSFTTEKHYKVEDAPPCDGFHLILFKFYRNNLTYPKKVYKIYCDDCLIKLQQENKCFCLKDWGCAFNHKIDPHFLIMN